MTNEPFDLHDAALRDRAVRAATGAAPFDVLITGGTVVDVATSELRAADVGLVGGLIASVHPTGSRTDAAETIDATGRFIAPGLIDSHMHVESSMTTPRRYAEVVVPQGTTTVVWDPHEIGNVAGLAGLAWILEQTAALPLRFLTLAPSCVPSAPGLELAGADFGGKEIAELLAQPGIVGLGEVMDMRGVIGRDPRMRAIVDAGLQSGKLVCGHARDLTGAALQAFAAAGIESDHEVKDGDDLLAKLRAGMTVELRGSHDYVLPSAVAALKTLPHLPQTLTFSTDDVFADDLVNKGGMIDVLRRLIAYGLPPMDGLRAVTLNAAMRLGRNDLGCVAPGRRADLVILDDLTKLGVIRVFVSGREAARDGVLLGGIGAAPKPAFLDTMKLAPLTPADFTLLAPADAKTVTINTVDQPRFTRWGARDCPVVDGRIQLADDLLIMAVIHRHGRAPATPVLGVLDGWGAWRGAIATTISHDSHNLTVFGRDPADMAAAANALIACGGGMAVAAAGQVIALLELPVCGLVSDAPASDVAAALNVLRDKAAEVADWKPPVRTFKSLVGASLACNPGPHVTDLGISDGSTGGFRPLIANVG